MIIKELTRFDLPGNYRSSYPNNDYMPDLAASNLKAVIDKLNEVIKFVNEQHPESENEG